MISEHKRKVYLRADADGKIGYGHFMRTLALAEMLSDEYDCVFATQSPSVFQKKCLKDVCNLLGLPSDETRFQLFVDFVKKGDIVVLDNYFYNTEYEQLLRDKGAKVVLIDNLHIRHSCADAVIGFTLGLKTSDYSVEPYTKLYLGPSYSLLRKPFIEQLQKKHKPVSNAEGLKVVISFGGADVFFISVAIANILDKSDKIAQITVIGNNLKGLRDSSKVIQKSHLSASDMRDAFVMNDIAVLPSSTTTLEALACGIPIIGGYFVDNQIENYNKYIKANVLIGCGDLTIKSNQNMVKDIIERKVEDGWEFPPSIIPSSVKNNILSIFEEI